jgi:hypothetical protein
MRPDTKSWIEAKLKGNAGEVNAAAFWAGLGFASYNRPGAHASDLLVQARVEHKADRFASGSRCVAIEFLCNGKPSGIAKTDADLWCISAIGESFIVPTSNLLELVERGPFRIVRAGDGKRALCVLVPIPELRRTATLVLPEGAR